MSGARSAKGEQVTLKFCQLAKQFSLERTPLFISRQFALCRNKVPEFCSKQGFLRPLRWLSRNDSYFSTFILAISAFSTLALILPRTVSSALLSSSRL